jgi:hypothetical protein
MEQSSNLNNAWWVAEEPLLFSPDLEKLKVVPPERFGPLMGSWR